MSADGTPVSYGVRSSTRARPTRTVVTRSGGGLRGWFISARFDAPVPFEGSTEKEALLLLDLSSRVLQIVPQPFKEKFAHLGVTTSRTPDFLIETTAGKFVVECKSSLQLARDKTQDHLRIAADHFERTGERYLVVTDKDLRHGQALVNALKLERFRIQPYNKELALAELRTIADTVRGALPCSVAHAIFLTGNETAVRRLIAARLVHIDYSQSLNNQTLLHLLPLKESNDAAFFLFSGSGVQLEWQEIYRSGNT